DSPIENRDEISGSSTDNHLIYLVSCYLKYPLDRSTKHAILILTDCFGLQKFHVRHIADRFAKSGYFVVIPDLFYGAPVPTSEFRNENFNMRGWASFHTPERAERIIDDLIKCMRDTLGCQRIGGVGYSFGGECLVQYLQPGKLDVGFIAHPTRLDSDMLADIEGPLSLALGTRDSVFTKVKRNEAERMLEMVRFPYQINLYSHVGHGFSGDANQWITVEKFAMEQSFQQALVWFDQYLKRD
ncbi:hypothetical protein N7540_003574, partial [Penicillium herquei]